MALRNRMDGRALKHRAIVKHKKEIARLKEEIRILEQFVEATRAALRSDGLHELLADMFEEALFEYDEFKLQQKLNKKGRG